MPVGAPSGISVTVIPLFIRGSSGASIGCSISAKELSFGILVQGCDPQGSVTGNLALLLAMRTQGALVSVGMLVLVLPGVAVVVVFVVLVLPPPVVVPEVEVGEVGAVEPPSPPPVIIEIQLDVIVHLPVEVVPGTTNSFARNGDGEPAYTHEVVVVHTVTPAVLGPATVPGCCLSP